MINAVLKSWYWTSISDSTNQSLKLPACRHTMARDFILHAKQLKAHMQGIHETIKLYAYNWVPFPRCLSNICEYSNTQKSLKSQILDPKHSR